MDFAKLFKFDDIGQVLVKVDDGEDGAEVRVYFQPKGLGVCSTAFTFKADEDEDENDKADKAFERIDEAKAYTIVTEVLKTIPSSLADLCEED